MYDMILTYLHIYEYLQANNKKSISAKKYSYFYGKNILLYSKSNWWRYYPFSSFWRNFTFTFTFELCNSSSLKYCEISQNFSNSYCI